MFLRIIGENILCALPKGENHGILCYKSYFALKFIGFLFKKFFEKN